ncbi:MAG: barstar family protein [Elusimicrobia bacterium]|nr:barstar family protein [Elusimicrobiota bacterium]
MKKKAPSLAATLADSSKPYLLRLKPGDLPAVRRAAGELSFGFWEMDAADLADEDAVWDLFAKTFAFPDHFGRNWDALIDCMRDLDLPRFKGHVLVLSHAEAARLMNPELFDKLIDVLACVSQEWDEWQDGRVSFKTILA